MSVKYGEITPAKVEQPPRIKHTVLQEKMLRNQQPNRLKKRMT